MTTLDEIVKSSILQKSLHFYVQAMSYAVECLRELQFDVIGTVRSKKIEISENRSSEIPCDYMDMVRIGFNRSDRVLPITSLQNTTRLINLDDTGARIPYGGDYWQYGDDRGDWIYAGSYYANRDYNGYSIVKERNEINLHNVCGNFFILDYITDGSEIDNASMVHPYAITTIKQYIDWQMKKHNRAYGPGEVQYENMQYDKMVKRLRGRMNPMKPADVIASMDRGYGRQK